MIDKIHDILTKGAVFDSEPIYCIILMNGKAIIDMAVTTKGNKEPIDIRHFLSIRSMIYNLDINSPEEAGILIRNIDGNLTVDKTPILDDPAQYILLETLSADGGVQFEINDLVTVNINKSQEYDMNKVRSWCPKPLANMTSNPPQLADSVRSNLGSVADDWQYIAYKYENVEETVIIAISDSTKHLAILEPTKENVSFK